MTLKSTSGGKVTGADPILDGRWAELVNGLVGACWENAGRRKSGRVVTCKARGAFRLPVESIVVEFHWCRCCCCGFRIWETSSFQ